MRERLGERLDELKAEEQAGQRALADLDHRRTDLQATLLRIGGAIQVLEEVLAEDPLFDAEPVEIAPAGNGQAGVPA